MGSLVPHFYKQKKTSALSVPRTFRLLAPNLPPGIIGTMGRKGLDSTGAKEKEERSNSSFLFLVVPGATSSVLAPSSDALCF